MFNRCHKRSGHLFQGRYKGILIQKDTHLLELCRYVVLNPVRVGMAELPGEWPWRGTKIDLILIVRYIFMEFLFFKFAPAGLRTGQTRSSSKLRTLLMNSKSCR